MTTDLHALSGAYALDALDDDERAEFRRHLSMCAECADEVAGLIATGARLGAAVAVVPPSSLHAAVMGEIVRTRQLTPLRPAEDDGVVTHLVRRARSRSRLSMAVAAALVVVAGTLGAVVGVEQHRVGELQQTVEAVAAVTSASDARTLSAAGAGGRMTVVSSLAQGRAVVMPQGVRAGDGRSMQLWVIHDGTFRSVGLVDGEQPLLAEDLPAGAALGVTNEPEGGSKQPTSAPVLSVKLA